MPKESLYRLTDATVISLCSVIVLEGRHRLTVLAPDETDPLNDPCGGPIWKILVHTPDPDPVDVLSWSTASFESLFRNLEDRLYNLVSSSLADETAERVKEELKRIFDEYHARCV